MTRFSIAIDSAGQQGRPTYSDSLGFVADTLTIVNPTVSTVYILAGGSTVPTSYANATDSVPPLSVRSLPVNSATFAVGFGSPTYPVTQPNPTTVATLLFTAGEPTPQYGAIPPAAFQLSGTINVSVTNATINANITNSTIDVIGLTDQETLLYDSGVTSGALVHTIALPAGARALTIQGVPATATKLNVSGVQSGFLYLAEARAPALFYRFPILASVDTSVSLAVTDAGAYEVRVWSHGGPTPPAADRGAAPLSHPVLPPPGGETYGQVAAPGAPGTIVTTGPLPAGTYRVDAHIYAADAAAAGRFVSLAHLNSVGGTISQILAPPPGMQRIVLPRLVLAANDALAIQSGAGGAGSFYGGMILWGLA